MVKKNIKYLVRKIVECIGVNDSILFCGQVMISLRANRQSLLMGYKQLRSSINVDLWSPDHCEMFSEDVKPKGGILSRLWNISGYLRIIIAIREGCRMHRVTESQPRRERLRWCQHVIRWWRYKMLWEESGVSCCDVGQRRVVVKISVMMVVCEIMGCDSDCTSKHEEWFECGRRTVCTGSVVGVGGFPFFSLYLFSCIAKQVMTLKQLQLLSCLISSLHTLSASCFVSKITFSFPISPRSDPAHYTFSRMCGRIWPKAAPLRQLNAYCIFYCSSGTLVGLCCTTIQSWAIQPLNWAWSNPGKSGKSGNSWRLSSGAWGTPIATLSANVRLLANCILKPQTSSPDCCAS